MTGILGANASVLLGAIEFGAPVCKPKTMGLQPKWVARQMDRKTAKLLGNIILPDWILEYLRCPQSSGTLLLASQAVLDDLSERARAGKLFSILGRTISKVPSQGLVSSDGRWFYSLNDGIACLMADEAIELMNRSER